MKSMLKSLMSVAAAALALTSCSNDATEEVISKGERKPLEVNATIDCTRTAMAADHVNLEWSDNDEILLYIGDKLAKADVIKHTIGNTLTAEYKDGDIVYANYSINNEKYSDGAAKAEFYITITQKQSTANVFAGENLPMVAQGTIANGKVDLSFKPVGCVLVFNVYGPAENEKIQSIKFTALEKCCGYKNCDLTADLTTGLTAEALGYKELTGGGNSATVELDTPAAIGTTKPTDTKIGENQVYLVVAPFNYTAATFTVTTDAGNTYTFETKNGIDCSQHTARVVNLNLAKSEELKPSIEVPTVGEQESVAKELEISPIIFNNIATDAIVDVKVYSDDQLTSPLADADSWITFTNTASIIGNKVLKCNIDANEGTTPRTAYIGIKCAGVQAAIAITQVAKNSTPATPDPSVAEVSKIVTDNRYKEYTTADWIVTYGGGLTNGIASLGSGSNKNASGCYLTKADYSTLADALGFKAPYNDSTDKKAAAIISQKALPAGYNNVTLEYNNVKAATQIAIAFSTDDGATWTIIKEFVELKASTTAGSVTYEFPQQGAGRYAFVAKSTAANSRITNCKITYSQK